MLARIMKESIVRNETFLLSVQVPVILYPISDLTSYIVAYNQYYISVCSHSATITFKIV